MEEWRDIEGFKGLYQVSDQGRVFAKKREIFIKKKGGAKYSYFKNPHELSYSKSNSGYLFVALYGVSSKKRANRYVHRLVAAAFIENPDTKETVNHKSGLKSDNRSTNLEWNTRQENMDHATINNLIKKGSNHYSAHLSGDDVLYIRKHLQKRVNTGELALKFNCSRKTILRAANKTRYANE